MKKFIIILFFFMQSSFSISSSNIVYLDVQYIIDNSELGIFYKKKISINQEKAKNELLIDEKIIKEKETFIKDKKNIIKKEDLDESLKEFNKLFADYQKKRNESRRKILDEKNKYTSKILEILNPLLTNYVEKNNIILVLEKKNILIGSKVLDITSNILKILNSETKEKNLINDN